MVPTNAQMAAIAGVTLTDAIGANAFSVTTALSRYGDTFGMLAPHRLAHYLAQLCEESGGWRWDKEIASGKEYEGRADLGNTQAGDGVRFKGRTAGQITGRANYRAFTKWVRAHVMPDSPDFEAEPELLNTDPWEGLGPMWFWATHKLNALADQNDIETITKRWNGGLNGFAVRVKFFTRAGLVLLGLSPDDIEGFQKTHGLGVDGDAGPKTRAKIFDLLSEMSPAVQTVKSPVVDTKTVKVEKTVAVDVKTPGMAPADAATGAGVGAGALGGTLQTLQEQLTPFSMAGGWIGKLVVILIIVGAVLTIGGLAWRFYASRKKKATIAAINAAPAT